MPNTSCNSLRLDFSSVILRQLNGTNMYNLMPKAEFQHLLALSYCNSPLVEYEKQDNILGALFGINIEVVLLKCNVRNALYDSKRLSTRLC